MSGEDADEVVIQGKRFKRVELEDREGDFLLDSQNNIYDLELNKIGVPSDDEDDDF